MRKVITEKIEHEIVSYYTLKPTSYQDVCDKFDLSRPTIQKILYKYNIPIYSNNLIFNPNLNENYFENIDTPNKAYFLGLIISDGNVFVPENNRQAVTSITLNEYDEYILYNFLQEIGSSREIAHDGRGASTAYTLSNKMVYDLGKYGIIPRKSFYTYLPILPHHLMPHLIRGILDGDGSVQTRIWKNKFIHSVGFCGSEILMNNIKDYLTPILNLTDVSVYSYKDRLLSMLTWGSYKDIESLYYYLYYDAEIYLLRKRQNFNIILDHYWKDVFHAKIII